MNTFLIRHVRSLLCWQPPLLLREHVAASHCVTSPSCRNSRSGNGAPWWRVRGGAPEDENLAGQICSSSLPEHSDRGAWAPGTPAPGTALRGIKEDWRGPHFNKSAFQFYQTWTVYIPERVWFFFKACAQEFLPFSVFLRFNEVSRFNQCFGEYVLILDFVFFGVLRFGNEVINRCFGGTSFGGSPRCLGRVGQQVSDLNWRSKVEMLRLP